MRIASTNSLPGTTNALPIYPGEMVYVPGSGQNPRFNWPVVAGKTYQLQFKDDLSAPDWQPVAGSMVIEGDQASMIDSGPNSKQRFYRVAAF